MVSANRGPVPYGVRLSRQSYAVALILGVSMHLKMRRLIPWTTLVLFLFADPLFGAVQRAKFSNSTSYVVIEVLDDTLLHVEFSTGSAPALASAIHTSPMVYKTHYAGPANYSLRHNAIETSALRAVVDDATLCVEFTDKANKATLTKVCPVDLGRDWKGLNLTAEQTQNVYGLGEQFVEQGSADGDWLYHHVRSSGPYGNTFDPFGASGMVGNVQIPVYYALGKAENYALFLDNVYKQTWDFSTQPWTVRMFGDQIQFYLIAGLDLPSLRKSYMELTGRPPVPPRKVFGLWVSEYGYSDWQEVEGLRDELRRDSFPVDGFVLDVQWFGGIKGESPDSAMGRLDWDLDLRAFPDPDKHIGDLASDHVGIIPIEDSYISTNTPTYADTLNTGKPLLAYSAVGGKCDATTHQPVTLTDWFGQAGMVDWSNPDASAWIHENRRFPNLVRKGVLGHWADLGEPEIYDPAACYQGVETTPNGPRNRHADIHNLYSFLWNQSIYEGYFNNRSQVDRRPFILSRSGTAGLQRFGSAMWSGDIASNLDSLATHANVQMHMSFSGIDYFGADIAGYRREAIPCNESHSGRLQYQDELYTQWFANGAWFDVPVRPHTNRSAQRSGSYQTAPNLIGNVDSNRENLRQRYELLPYYYSLAYRAYLFGEPVVPPLVFYYQNDPNVRNIGHEKLIGRDLLVAMVAKHGESMHNIYLPKGRWADYHTNEWFDSTGTWIRDYPLYLDNTFRLPAFARAGAILPMMYVDAETKDAFGHRKDNATRDELVVKVYAGAAPTNFTLYEDDGTTLGYDPQTHRPVYNYRTTQISQQATNTAAKITIGGAQGSYRGAPSSRNNVVRLIVEDGEAHKVILNGADLPQRASKADFDANASGWYNEGRNAITAKSGPQDVGSSKIFEFSLGPVAPVASIHFACENGWTRPGEEVFITGDSDALGAWDLGRAVKLNPSVNWAYINDPPPFGCGTGPTTPTWTGLVSDLPANTKLEWKCVKKLNNGQWQTGTENKASTTRGFGGTSKGAF